ncbi:MAG: hypothetical protein K6C05_10935 [Anaerovibrio sp.]|uniref:hypothetical protein n=1 Tax=Anaerovibrio sp. TaxID=1872532 RepID=UPI0025F49583|nr:hypothetical protein [Anaerovibrio sp.]MCR5177342.1 hypothetical protein [Anaerovibrio sp.]
MMKNKSWILLFTALLLVAVLGTCHAAHRVDRRFVDSDGYTGYYVDVNSISYDGGNELSADIYIVKARYNTMFMYRTNFNRADQSYQYMATKVYKYDTRELTGQSDVPSLRVGYSRTRVGNNPIMEKVLDYAIHWKNTHLYLTKEGELLE